jgi:hypothetical protein
MPILCDVCKSGIAFYKGSELAEYVWFCPTCLDKKG